MFTIPSILIPRAAIPWLPTAMIHLRGNAVPHDGYAAGLLGTADRSKASAAASAGRGSVSSMLRSASVRRCSFAGRRTGSRPAAASAPA